MKTENQKILDYIYEFFLNSNDFNGITIRELSEKFEIEYIKLVNLLKILISDNQISVQDGINPHIISLCYYDLETQLIILDDAKESKYELIEFSEGSFPIYFESYKVCIYPSQLYLKEKRNLSKFSLIPYSKELALGEPQLKPIYFNLEVLERYNNDPRYKFKFEDYSGNISYEDDDNLEEKDRVFINSFGLGLDNVKNRIVVVYLCYLNKLNSEHQLFWKNKEIINTGCSVLNEYYINTIGGKPTNCCSIYNAVLNEQIAINQLCNNAFNKPFFRNEYSRYDKPQEFNTLLFPTLKNYYEFILTAEKLFVDNINKEFFKGQIDLIRVEKHKDGTTKKIDKGTILLFEDWLNVNHSIARENGFNERFFKPFKKIRKDRQNPAHKILKNVFNKEYRKLQNQIISELYDSLHIFRQMLQSHSKNKDVEVDKWLDNSEVKIY